MTELLRALRLRDGRVADVLADGHAGLFGGAGEQSLLVVGEADGQHLGSRVAGRWPAGAGTHGHEVTVSHGVTKCYTSCDTESLADQEFVLYDKSMTTTAFDLLTKAMSTNPDLIRSVVELDDDHPDLVASEDGESIAPVIMAVRYSERYMKCASCRADATLMITVDGRMGATSCARHRDLWIRRSGEQATR